MTPLAAWPVLIRSPRQSELLPPGAESFVGFEPVLI